ncbi:unnamed protein product [Rotaria sp. Silwood1]|nr:unnamed protein product [Rotaria sp. Silwood1]
MSSITSSDNYNYEETSIVFLDNDIQYILLFIIETMMIVFIIIYIAVYITRLVHIYFRLYLSATSHPTLNDVLPSPATEFDYPLVAVQLPMMNEIECCKSIIECACNLEWPRNRLFIQVVDDSTNDEAKAIVDECVQNWIYRGVQIGISRRIHRQGFKAGGLINGRSFIPQAEYIVLFDADFLPTKDYLLRTLPILIHDSNVAFVQARWTYTNAKESFLTRVQEINLNFHHKCEQEGRSRASLFVTFNGTGGVWRASAIEQAGGWHTDTVVEDLDLALRAHLNGWRAHHHQSILKTPSNRTIHVNIRSTNNKSINRYTSLHSTPIADYKMYHYRDDAQKTRNNRTFQQHSKNILDFSNPYFIKVNDSTKNSQQYMNLSTNSDNMENYSQSIIVKTKIHRKQLILKFTRVAILRWNQTGITVAGISGTSGNVNYNNHRIQKYLVGASHGTTICGNGTRASSLNQLAFPSQVLVDSNGNIRVADLGNHRILFYNGTSTGILIGSTGGYGVLNNQSRNPYGIEYDSAFDTLYIADYSNHRIMCYVSGASSSSLVAGNGTLGIGITQLEYPVRVYLDSFTNNLIIVNHIANNIVCWPLGDSSWTLVAGDINGNAGNNATTLNHPTDVILDPMGNMYVADRENHRIQLFMYGQTEGITIAGVTSVNGSNSTLFNKPWSVELDSQLNLYVADSYNHRMQKFLRY